VGRVAEARPNGVVPDVEAGFGKVLVVAKDAREEPVLKEMADAVVPLIEPLRVNTVDGMQAPRKTLKVRLDNQVVVIPHQAVGVTSPLPTSATPPHETYEGRSVGVIKKDLGLGNSPCRDVVHAVRR
jgi:hypothetical protein